MQGELCWQPIIFYRSNQYQYLMHIAMGNGQLHYLQRKKSFLLPGSLVYPQKAFVLRLRLRLLFFITCNRYTDATAIVNDVGGCGMLSTPPILVS
ncbi:hypothetical protein VNO77_20482 [Canavalia gladiata]|uniref:Uncharacterized protein n=1 Tax=Canavalia gladiata TaxID=3824 RepID=A0AAN9QLG7_CANGL